MAVSAILDFKKFEIVTEDRSHSSNFVPIGQAVAEIWPFFDYFLQNGCHPPYWICYIRMFGPHAKSIWWSFSL